MSNTNRHLGKKILFSIVIALSSLMLLLSVVGIIGVWVVERPLSDAAVSLLIVVEDTSKVLQSSITQVDQTLVSLEELTTTIVDASQQLSQNVTDSGLVSVLLPEEKEQQLTEAINSVKDTFQGIQEMITKGLDLYQSINKIPFVNLPVPSEDQIAKLESSLAQIQTLIETIQTEIANIRSGVAGAIDKVGAAASQVNEAINKFQDGLSQLNSMLVALEELSVNLQQIIPGLFIAIALIFSLILAYLIYTQVEVILLYVRRWHRLGQSVESLPVVETPTENTKE